MSSWTQDEDSFQGHVMSTYRQKFYGKIYPRVTRIGGKSISPDIDALGVRGKIIVGYEFKLLDKKTPGANYRLVHQGIGQTLSYFNHGIDLAYLVLGIADIPARYRILEKIAAARRLVAFLSKQHGFDRFRIWTFDDEKKLSLSIPHKTIKMINEGLIPSGFCLDELSRNEIFSGKLTWTKGKRFLKEYNIRQ